MGLSKLGKIFEGTKLLFLEWVHSCNIGEISQNERMTQWEGNYKAYLFLRANLMPLWQYLFHKFFHLGGWED